MKRQMASVDVRLDTDEEVEAKLEDFKRWALKAGWYSLSGGMWIAPSGNIILASVTKRIDGHNTLLVEAD